MIYLKNFLFCLIVIFSIVIQNSFGDSSSTNSLSDNDEISQKLAQYLEEKNADEFDNENFSDVDLKYLLLKRALPRMGKRFWDDYDFANSEESDYVDKRAIPRFGRALPRMGRALPRMGRALPRMGRALPRMGRTLPRMG